jgi:hypothetical protein
MKVMDLIVDPDSDPTFFVRFILVLFKGFHTGTGM